MALFTRNEIRAKASYLSKSASIILAENYTSFSKTASYDIFLSHSYLDADEILGLKLAIEELGYNVYVDWIVDRQLNRSNVNKETAAIIRTRMENCKSLFFATSNNSTESKWMPWELGYFDGIKKKVAILPIADNVTFEYKGQEYLGLYPYVMKAKTQGGNKEALWIHNDSQTYIIFEAWLNGTEPYRRT